MMFLSISRVIVHTKPVDSVLARYDWLLKLTIVFGSIKKWLHLFISVVPFKSLAEGDEWENARRLHPGLQST